MDQNHKFRWTKKYLQKDTMLLLQKRPVLHVFNMFLSSLLVNEVSQSSRDIKVLGSLFTDLFVGEIYERRANMLQMFMKTTDGKNMRVRSSLHEGRGFTALGLMKILGINGVLLLSTFSLNFIWGLAIFFAWSSRNVSERLPELEPWWIKALFTKRCEAWICKC